MEEGAGGGSFAQEIEHLFSESGALSRSEDFEYRPEQQSMAVAVAKSLRFGQPLLVEAGTGVGKSLAYLLPSVLLGKETGGKVVISTHTINLQEQLIRKDIPIVKKVLKHPFHAVLFKGRGNYVCPRRMEAALKQAGDLFTQSDQEE
ncbi:MAG: DEAD/DEAH box helicase, partial [Verrucomicrobiota bacterium]